MAESPPLDICRSLRGERIFITGGTGFIGKVLIEKLLWSVPEIGRLILLIRPTQDRTAAERLREEILDSPLTGRLRAFHAEIWERWVASKIHVVSGDLAQDGFGLEAGEYARLSGSVDRVVACAATVTFDERLDRALELNVRGAQRTLRLAQDAGDAPLLHVSTCFVNGGRDILVPERVLPPCPPAARESAPNALDLSPEAMLAALEKAEREGTTAGRGPAASGAEMAARYGYSDVYTLTKALGERLIEQARGQVPVAILRPAIVESALAEPIPGWIDGVRVADPLLVAYGRGQSRDFPGTPEAKLEIVPVDYVVNAMIAALARLHPAATSIEELPVYQLASARNPITLRELVGHARDGFARTPLRDENGEAIKLAEARFLDPDLYRRRLLRRRRSARWVAPWLGSSALGKRLLAAERKLAHFVGLCDVYRPYLDHTASYDDSATQSLWRAMSAPDQLTFPFDIGLVDWPSYVADVHVPGLERFALKAENGLPPVPRPNDPTAAAHRHGEFPAARAATLDRLFATAAESDPEAIAFQTCREGRWLRYTYGQAQTSIVNIASRLRSRYAIQRGDRVVLWGSASPEWVLTSFAVHSLGAVTVPLDPQWPVEEVEKAAQFTGAKVICANPELGSRLRTASERPPLLPVLDLKSPFVPEPDVSLLPGVGAAASGARPDDPATILFTSGTTVAPKAVRLTHRNLLANVRDLVPVMRSSRQRLLSVLPIHHVFEFTVGLLVPIVGGGTISYVSELKPAEISWMMSATRPTMLVAVPRLLELLNNGVRQSIAAGGPMLGAMFRLLFGLSSLTGGRAGHMLFGKVHRRFGGALRRIATGGSALEPSLGRTFRLMGFQVAEGYGMTETSPVLTVNPWTATRFGTVGRPLPGVDVEIRPVAGANNGTGQIWVRGANVMSGYYRNSEATDEALERGWLNTGDIGSFDDEGYLRVSGRTKDVIVTSAGKNVYPEEVEHRYRGLDGVQELVVVGLPATGGGECVTAVIVPPPDATEDDVEAIHSAVALLSSKVPSYQRISRLEIWRGDLPKTTTLKVKRGQLRNEILAGKAARQSAPLSADRDEPSAGPVLSEKQAWVLATLARLTRHRLDLLKGSDRLAELGVDSLARVELMAEIEGHFDLRVDDDSAAALSRVSDVLELVRGGETGARPQAG